MARFWPLSVVVIVLTVAPMYTAWAECAWVLWLATWDDKTREYQYRYVDAFTTHPACYEEASFRNRNAEARERVPGLRMGVLQCAPDTIDPRGSKGGR